MDEAARKKNRNWIYHHLRCHGYIEAFFENGRSQWSAAEAALVERADNGFVLIGDTQAKHQLVKAAKSVSAINLDVDTEPKEMILPRVLAVNATAPEVQKLAMESGLSLCLNFQQQIFDALPDAGGVFSRLLVELKGLPKIQDLDCSQYSLQDRQWTAIRTDYARSPGLYKTQFKNRVMKFLLVSSDNSAFELSDPEWGLVCLFGKLKEKIEVRYNQSKKTLAIQRIPELRLPTLIERALRSGTMEAPSITDQWNTYGNIQVRSAWFLASKFPMFRVTNI
ncbi:MAG: hypothetical protein K2X93_29240 [Candidatus Obscuribacterales bacterium]|nr:hypothetical protein [Candidatus Obscuribacterales bacterium]